MPEVMIDTHVITPDDWPLVAALGPDGGDDGCWCMGWRGVGIARALLTAAVEAARAAGARAIEGYVFDPDAPEVTAAPERAAEMAHDWAFTRSARLFETAGFGSTDVAFNGCLRCVRRPT